MTPQEQTIEALNRAITIQSELIAYLKAEIERLKNSTKVTGPWPLTVDPLQSPSLPQYGYQPFINTTPIINPYVVTCHEGNLMITGGINTADLVVNGITSSETASLAGYGQDANLG